MHGQNRQLPPAIEVSDRIEAIRGFVVEELTLSLLPPVATGRFENHRSEAVGALESNQGGHSPHRHATDGHSVEIESPAAEGKGHVIDFGGRLLDVVQQGLRSHEFLGTSFSVAREIDRTASDADPGQSQISTGIKFLVGGSPVHPDQEGNSCFGASEGFTDGADDEAGHVGSEADMFGDRPKAGRKAGVEIRHGDEE